MTDDDKARLAKKISSEIETLRADIENLANEVRAASTDDTDEITRMDSLVMKRMKEAALSSAKHRLAVLQHASTRIDDEDFGYCAECGEEIPLPRLMVMPEATYCVDCAEEHS